MMLIIIIGIGIIVINILIINIFPYFFVCVSISCSCKTIIIVSRFEQRQFLGLLVVHSEKDLLFVGICKTFECKLCILYVQLQ